MSMLGRIMMIAAIASGLGAVTLGSAAASVSTEAEAANPLTHKEIYRIYAQKSWIWKAGAGYFSVKERRFTAWSGKSSTATYGVGRWFITGPGKLCFRADWHAQSGSAPATTCFSHRKLNGVVYQKREPKGKWYVFKNAPAKTDDEFVKLRRGNYVDARLGKIEARLDALK